MSAPAASRPRRQLGYTLIEVSIATAIALFLLGGLFTILQGTRRTYVNQNLLSQLQDNQRLAMTLITDIVQEAGYFSAPTTNTSAGMLPAVTLSSGAALTAGQALYGTQNAADPGDTITVRYTTSAADSVPVINCIGQSGGAGPNYYISTFAVSNTGASTGQLTCSVTDGAAATGLVGGAVAGLKRMDIWYGVNNSGTGNGVDTYYRASALTTAAKWGNVSSVKITLTFNNPLFPQPGQPAQIQFSRVIAIMNRAGVSG